MNIGSENDKYIVYNSAPEFNEGKKVNTDALERTWFT